MEDIKLTKKQQECVNFSDDKDLLVRGVAGSGKSLVILHRALALHKKASEQGKNIRIAIFTYTNALVRYTMEVRNLKGLQNADIHVSTLDSELNSVYRMLFNSFPYIKYNYRKDAKIYMDWSVARVKESADSRFLEDSWRDYLWDELEWMKQRMISTREEYLKVVRTGRGSVRPSDKERNIIFDVYELFYKALAIHNCNSIEIISEQICRKLDCIPDIKKYDYVMIDECQDLTLGKILMAKALAKKSLTIAADFAQRIYKTGFSWSELGISVRGNASKKLQGTFRNTKEILLLAQGLVKNNNELKNNDDEYVKPEIPTASGPKPMLFICSSEEKELGLLTDNIKDIQRRRPDFTIGIIYRESNQKKKLETALRYENIDFQLVEGKAYGAQYELLQPGVKIVTYHSSKGLEFDVVLLPFLNAGSFTKVKDNMPEEVRLEEFANARNLLYVGITRAKNLLYMSCTENVASNRCELLSELEEDKYAVYRM